MKILKWLGMVLAPALVCICLGTGQGRTSIVPKSKDEICQVLASDIKKFLDGKNAKIKLGSFQYSGLGKFNPSPAILALVEKQLGPLVVTSGARYQLGGTIEFVPNLGLLITPEITDLETRTAARGFTSSEMKLDNPNDLYPILPWPNGTDFSSDTKPTITPGPKPNPTPMPVTPPDPIDPPKPIPPNPYYTKVVSEKSTHYIDNDGWIRPSKESPYKVMILAGRDPEDENSLSPRKFVEKDGVVSVDLQPGEYYQVKAAQDENQGSETAFTLFIDGMDQFVFNEESGENYQYRFFGGSKSSSHLVKGWYLDKDRVSGFLIHPCDQGFPNHIRGEHQAKLQKVSLGDVGIIAVRFHSASNSKGKSVGPIVKTRTVPGKELKQQTEAFERYVDPQPISGVKILYNK